MQFGDNRGQVLFLNRRTGRFRQRGAACQYGRGIISLHSTTKNETITKIVPTFSPGAVVTTSKNNVDIVVTEHGIAELKGKTIRERARALISIAHPKFREELKSAAQQMRYL